MAVERHGWWRSPFLLTCLIILAIAAVLLVTRDRTPAPDIAAAPPAAVTPVPAAPVATPAPEATPAAAWDGAAAFLVRARALASRYRVATLSPTARPTSTIPLSELAGHPVTAACTIPAGATLRSAAEALGYAAGALPDITVQPASTGLLLIGGTAPSYGELPAAWLPSTPTAPCITGSFLSLRLFGEPVVEGVVVDVVP